MKDYSFGNYICALRTGLGLSQFQLGTLVGVTDKAVSKWENGDAKPRLATCYRLAEVLGVSINELLSCEQYVTIPARKELDKMNQQLWKEAYDKLTQYNNGTEAVCWSRLAAEEAALKGTDAISAFSVLGKMQQAASENNTAIIIGGSIGSSFAAWLLGATLSNPLPPHYICEKCGHTEFIFDISDGFDLPPKKCLCGHDLKGDGHNIPYEGYAKVEQTGTHVEIRLSKNFRPTAINILINFYDGVANMVPMMVHGENDAWQMERYILLPKHKAKPTLSADGFFHLKDTEYWQTYRNETTFCFLISDQLNKIDKLRDATGVTPPNPLLQLTPQIMKALWLKKEKALSYVTKSLDETLDFDLLMRLELLSHATGAWEHNGEILLQNGKIRFRELPVAREDIFNLISLRLTAKGIKDNGLALYIMENARKGLFCSRGMPERIEKLLRSLDLPDWYPGYLKNVKYLFPKAHCIAHILIEIIDEWYQIHHPEIYKMNNGCK